MSDKDNLSIRLDSMLDEIVRICKKNKINYYLLEEALVSAIRGKHFSDGWKTITIAVHARDVNKIVAAVNKKKHRTIESLMNNHKFPGLYMRYVDTGTLLFDSSSAVQKYKYPSVAIDIYILFPHKTNNGFKSKLVNFMKRKWAQHIGNVKSEFGLKIYEFLARKLNFRKRFKRMLKRNWRTAEKVEFYSRDGKCHIVNKACFKKPKKSKVGNKTYSLPTSKYYIARLLNNGKLTLGVKNAGNRINKNHIINLNVSGRDFFKEIKKQGLHSRKNVNKMNSYLKWKKNVFLPIWNKRIQYYNFYFLTKERYAFYDTLVKENKNDIIEMKNNEDYASLAVVLKEHNKRLYHYSKLGKGLFFDAEVFSIAILTMVHNELYREKVFSVAMKNIKRYCNIINMVPNSFLKPLEETDKVYSEEELEQKRCEIKAYIENEVEKMIESKKNSEEMQCCE